MEELESLNAQYGRLEALNAWNRCINVNGTSRDIGKINKRLVQLRNGESRLLESLKFYIEEVRYGEILDNCRMVRKREQEMEERRIELMNRPNFVRIDSGAFCNMTTMEIPEDIMMALSWGPKFTFPYILNEENIMRYLAQIEYVVERTVPTAIYDQVNMEICKHISSEGNKIHSHQLQWLLFLKYRTETFLKSNPLYRPIPSDKGKIIVYMEIKEYELKLGEHLANDEHYVKVDYDPLHSLRIEEAEILRDLRQYGKIKHMLKSYPMETMQLPRFYATIKAHKDNKLRPITSNAGDVVGATLNNIFKQMLTEVFPVDDIHCKSALDLKRKLDNLVVPEDYALVSFDAISMFTSVPTNLVMCIIKNKLNIFRQLFDITGETVIRIMVFLLNECTYFQSLDGIYKQKHGLPMGGSISPICCRLVMDYIINIIGKKIPKPLLLSVYVDDTLFIIRRNEVDNTLRALNSVNSSIQFTYELEREGMLNFLNITILRGENGIYTNWYKKEYSSNRLLNYLSSHKRSTIMNTAAQFIVTVLQLSDPIFFQENRAIITKILFDNCFPEIQIIALLHDFYTYMKPVSHSDRIPNANYISFPHQINNGGIKNIIRRSKTSNSVLAESIKNNKINFIKNIKCKIPIQQQTNAILRSECICGVGVKISSTKFNQTVGMLEKQMSSTQGSCHDGHHVFKRFKYYKGLHLRQQTLYLKQFLQWKERNKLVGSMPQFPNKNLRRILNNEKFKDKKKVNLQI